MVPNAPFRERFFEMQAQGEITLSQLCVFMGWVYRPSPERLRAERRRPGSVKADTSLARRALGIDRHPCRNFDKQYVSYETGLRLCRALGMDPHEAGV